MEKHKYRSTVLIVGVLVLLTGLGVEWFTHDRGGPRDFDAEAARQEPLQPARSDDFAHIPQQVASGTGVVEGNPPALGSCASIDEFSTASGFRTVACDSNEAAYKVVFLGFSADQCRADVDHRYFKPGDGWSWVACLDYNWQRGKCLAIQDRDARVVSCDDRRYVRYRPDYVLVNAKTTAFCRHGGFAHPYRLFTICATRMEKQ